jgi:hypothetical protein
VIGDEDFAFPLTKEESTEGGRMKSAVGRSKSIYEMLNAGKVSHKNQYRNIV